MKAGIIILNYNDYEKTIKLLERIKDYKCLLKIVVVDNNSSDESVRRIKPFENEKIILLENKENKGYAYGNNVGLKYLANNTKCEIAIISNPDIEVFESVLEELLKDFKKNKDISFLGPKILEDGHISKGWKLPNFVTEVLSSMIFFHRYVNRDYPLEHYQEKLTKVSAIHGCFFLGRLSDFKKIKYFDPNTFLFYEEFILGKKCAEKNLSIYVDTSLSVTHEVSSSVKSNLRKIKKYKIKSQSMFYYEKAYNHIGFLKLFILKLIYYITLFILYLTFWVNL